MHYSCHETLADFYRTHGPAAHDSHISWNDVSNLIEELKGKALVQIHKDDSVTVVFSDEKPERRPAQNKYKRNNRTKLSFSIDKRIASRFSAACALLGMTQGSVLLPVIKDVIREAEERFEF
jgi:hypothetical protein